MKLIPQFRLEGLFCKSPKKRTLARIGAIICIFALPGIYPISSPAQTRPSKTATTPAVIRPPAVRPFRVVAYVTDSILQEQIQFQKLTHVIYSFLIPNPDGTFHILNNPAGIKGLVGRCHLNGVKILIAIGGWGRDDQFERLAASQKTRAVFLREAFKVVDAYGFDGIDIDWEYPDPGRSSENYYALISELRAARPGSLLTSAIIDSGDDIGLGIPAKAFALLDFVNVMTYDGPRHGTMEQFTTGIAYWLKRGLPPGKMVPGLPFYSRPGELSYLRLIQNNAAASRTDTFKYGGVTQRYNGIPTVQMKTRIALEKASGIMFWTLEYDCVGATSLLTAINQTITAYQNRKQP